MPRPRKLASFMNAVGGRAISGSFPERATAMSSKPEVRYIANTSWTSWLADSLSVPLASHVWPDDTFSPFQSGLALRFVLAYGRC